MERNDYPEFMTVLGTLAHGLGVTLDDARVDFYWQMLADVSLAQFHDACFLAGKYAKKFPLPADFREYVDQVRQEHRAQQSWRQPKHALPGMTETRSEEGLQRVREILGGVLHALPDVPVPHPERGRQTHPAYLAPEDPVKKKALLREQFAALLAQGAHNEEGQTDDNAEVAP